MKTFKNYLKQTIERFHAISIIFFLNVLQSFAQSSDAASAVNSLVKAECAFAGMSVEKGMKPAFLAYLADDALVFRPGPVNGKSVWKDRKETTARLEWHPTLAFVCASGDLGYTSGPWMYTSEAHLDQPPAYGYFFSVWEKQEDGQWKVKLDLGTHTDPPSSQDTSLYVPAGFSNAITNPETEKANVMRAENDFSKIASAKGMKWAFDKFLLEDGRVYRPGQFPVQGRESVRAAFERESPKTRSLVTACNVSKSGDLAYVHGTYISSDTGYFVRVWRKMGPNNWKLALDIISPDLKEK